MGPVPGRVVIIGSLGNGFVPGLPARTRHHNPGFVGFLCPGAAVPGRADDGLRWTAP